MKANNKEVKDKENKNEKIFVLLFKHDSNTFENVYIE